MTEDTSKDTAEQPSQDRATQRLRTLRRGRIVMNRRHSSVDVVVRDLSATGAKLKLQEIWMVPTEFDLQLLSPSGAVELVVPCQRRWQTGILVGAQFVRPAGD